MNDTALPPIQYALQPVDDNNVPAGMIGSQRYETEDEAKQAVKEMATDERFMIIEVREQHVVDPETLAAEEAQIEANGRRDIDEPSDGEPEEQPEK